MVLKRKIISELMTTYFPTLLLTAITFATTFFKPFFFEAALSVNLTTMLVMTTIFISKMEGLPPTSDIKMIDVWLILCQLVPFIEAVMLTAIEYHRETDHVDLVNPGSKTRRANSKLFGKLSQKLEIVGGITLCSLHIFKGWGLSAKLGIHSAIGGKLGTALQAFTLNPCTKFPPNPTSRKVNT